MNYDVFLSHNSKDKPAVEAIGQKLQETYGLKCWLDKWNLIPGDPWQEAIEEALDDSQTFAIFVGPNDISPWENEEMRSAIEDRVRDRSRRVIPVLLPGAPDSETLKLPRFLKRLTWVDFRAGLDDEDALHRLYCGITGKAPGPSKETIIETSKESLPFTIQTHQLEQWIQPLLLLRRGDLDSDSEISLKDALIKNQKIILIGNSGSGKTYTMKAAANEINQGPNDLCLWIPLMNYSNSLNSTIKSILSWRDIPNDEAIQRLQDLNAILLLDGLNEVTKKKQERCISEIQVLLGNYKGSVCVSYPSSDHGYFGFNYPVYKMVPLNRQQIETAVTSFFEAIGKKHKADWFLQYIRGWEFEGREDFDALAKIPINLQFLLELVQNDDFTYTSLNDLYGQVIQKRLERTKLHTQRGQILVDIKTDCLMKLAYQSILSDQPLQFQRGFAKNVFVDEVGLSKKDAILALEEIIRSGLLLEANEFLLEWPHPSFKDYLAGRQLFDFVEMEKPLDDFPLDKPQGVNAAAHATRILTTQSRKLENRSKVFISLLEKLPNFEIVKTVANEYNTALEYYKSTESDLVCDANVFARIKWGERFLKAYQLVKEFVDKNNFLGLDKIPSPSGLDIFFDAGSNFCLVLFTGSNAINFDDVRNFNKKISQRKKRRKASQGFCLYAPFLLLLDPEIFAYLQVGIWLRTSMKNKRNEIGEWHQNMSIFISPRKEWIYWSQKDVLPEPNFNLVAGPQETMDALVKRYGRESVRQLQTTTDIFVRPKNELLSWHEIYMPITFQIDPTKLQERPHLTSNRLSQFMLLTPPPHHISLMLLMPTMSALRKIDFNYNILVPFPVTFLNRYYFMYFSQMNFSKGNELAFVHLRG